jgi:hypothetical protein
VTVRATRKTLGLICDRRNLQRSQSLPSRKHLPRDLVRQSRRRGLESPSSDVRRSPPLPMKAWPWVETRCVHRAPCRLRRAGHHRRYSTRAASTMKLNRPIQALPTAMVHRTDPARPCVTYWQAIVARPIKVRQRVTNENLTMTRTSTCRPKNSRHHNSRIRNCLLSRMIRTASNRARRRRIYMSACGHVLS